MTSTDLVVQSDDLVQPSTLFGTDNPGEVVERAAKVATTLADLVHKQNLVVRIGQSDHVRVEGWTLLGSMLGVFPIVVWTRPVLRDEQPFGWEARVEARTRAGEVVGAAEAECLRDEKQWSFEPTNRYGKRLDARDDYALRSMAQTRAVSKALRLPLGFVMQLAGFNPTPAEEMTDPPPREYDAAEDVPFGDDPTPYLPPTSSAGEPQAESDESRREPSPSASQDAAGAAEPASPADNDPLAKRKTKLDVIVKGKLKPPLRKVWTTVAKMRGVTTDALIVDLGGIEEDGDLHWTPLRDAMTAGELDALIEKLEKLSPFQPPPGVQAQLEEPAA